MRFQTTVKKMTTEVKDTTQLLIENQALCYKLSLKKKDWLRCYVRSLLIILTLFTLT